MDIELQTAFEQTTGLVLAAEAWPQDYQQIPDEHAQLIKLIAQCERKVLQYFKQLASKTDRIVRWNNYELLVKAYDVDVFIDDDALDQSDTQFIQIIFDTLASAAAVGALSAAKQFPQKIMPLGLTTRDELIQQMTTEQIGALIGKKIDANTGLLVDNPNARYNIDETTRTKIANSIKTSINLGESQTQATARLQTVIADRNRAAMIARTETVRAFAQGRHAYGRLSGATGKQWSDSNAIDICADNTAQGIIPFDMDFVSGDPFEPAHINCRCLTRLVYADEYDATTDEDVSETAAE